MSDPSGMQCFVFNLRKPMFQDLRVREALGYAFDFEWANKNLFYGQYKRTKSYLRQFRARFQRPAEPGGAEDPGASSRQDPR